MHLVLTYPADLPSEEEGLSATAGRVASRAASGALLQPAQTGGFAAKLPAERKGSGARRRSRRRGQLR